MKNKDLIEILQKLDPEAEIVVNEYEGTHEKASGASEGYIQSKPVDRGIFGCSKYGDYEFTQKKYIPEDEFLDHVKAIIVY